MWQTDECAWSVENLWRWSDYVERGIFLGLTLMVAYTFFVLIRFLRSCLLAHLESRTLQPESSPEFLTRRRLLFADLSAGLGILKGIGTAAPFLGLAGTAYGILLEFSGWGMSKGSAILYLLKATPSNLLTSALGILVAVPAVVVHDVLRSSVNKMRRDVSIAPSIPKERPFRRAQTLPLKHRFATLPAFPLIVVPIFTLIVAAYIVAPTNIATGLAVRLLPIGAPKQESPPVIVITVVARADTEYAVLLNSEMTPIDHLEEALAEKLKLVPNRRVYVDGDRTVTWGQVARVVDAAKHLQCEVVLLTTVPAVDMKRHQQR